MSGGTSVETIRDRAVATLRLVDTLERGGVLGPAPAAALRNSLGGVLVPLSAASSPDVERDELDELRTAVRDYFLAQDMGLVRDFLTTRARLVELVGGAS
jgi:hypothetical protein